MTAMAHELKVWLFADRIGTLTQVDGQRKLLLRSRLAIAQRRRCLVRLAAPASGAVRRSQSAPVLAPFYDTLSTAVYPTLTQKMAMKIGSKYKFSEVEN
jgi:hypothetical protein